MDGMQQPVLIPGEEVAAQAFEDFFRSHQERLLSAMYVVTGDRHLAEDVTQDAFVALFERWERVRSLEDPIGYLYRTALNRARRHFRRVTSSVTVALRLAPSPQLYEVDERDAVLRALRMLTQRQRAALMLTEMLGFDSASAGRLLGVSAVTVRRLASKGRAALRVELEGQDV